MFKYIYMRYVKFSIPVKFSETQIRTWICKFTLITFVTISISMKIFLIIYVIEISKDL